MRKFDLIRTKDVTGLTGEGVVAHGWETDSGRCVMRWHGKHSSTVFYQSMTDVEHIHGHEGRTYVQYRGIDKGPASIMLNVLAWAVYQMTGAMDVYEEKRKSRNK